MIRARHSRPMELTGRIAELRATEEIHWAEQYGKAARAVAQHSTDAEDCAALLAMLGLDASQGKADADG